MDAACSACYCFRLAAGFVREHMAEPASESRTPASASVADWRGLPAIDERELPSYERPFESPPQGKVADWRTFPAIDPRKLPSSDGQPVADNTRQAEAMFYTRGALEGHFVGRSDITVASNLLVYFPMTGPGRATRRSGYGRLAPDVFVADAPMHHRPSYRIADDQPPPRWVLEILCHRTVANDLGRKRDLYEEMGVDEYFLFDSREPFREPRLVGLRLGANGYREIEPVHLPNGALGIPSEVLGLAGRVDNADDLRWFDPRTGEDLRTQAEERFRAEEAEAKAAAASAREQANVRRMHEAGMPPAQIAELLDIDMGVVRQALA